MPTSSNPFDEPEPYPDSNVSIDDMRRQQQQIIAGVYFAFFFKGATALFHNVCYGVVL